MSTAKSPTSNARQRLLETADRLFYKEGLRAVGIDKIIAEAGVAKMTLYTHFPSKDDLIVAVLRHRDACVMEFFQAAMERHGKKNKNKFQAFFATLKEWFERPDFRGCAFVNAAVELADDSHAGVKFVRDQHERFTELIASVVADSLGRRDGELTDSIYILVEGAIVAAQIHNTSKPADTAFRAASKLLEKAKGS